MNCPHCAATTTRKRTKKTTLGYTTHFCPQCRSTFNVGESVSLSEQRRALLDGLAALKKAIQVVSWRELPISNV